MEKFILSYLLLGVCVFAFVSAQDSNDKPPPPKNGLKPLPRPRQGILLFLIAEKLIIIFGLKLNGPRAWERSNYHQGDIIFGHSDITRNGVTDTQLRWTKGIIPYFINETFGVFLAQLL